MRYFISDTHFGHEKCWSTFKRADGSPLRAFSSTEEMDEHMIEQWNATVKPEDSVYHLGDYVINRRFMHVAHRLNGRKRLVRGNHDLFKTQEYLDCGFEEIYGVWVDPGSKVIASHIPIHPESIKPGWLNVHGHLHSGCVMRPGSKQWIEKELRFEHTALEHIIDVFKCDYSPEPDPRYFCVSVENIDYTPITLEQIRERSR
jgi:calcineurin-like phosphoesterase family protein